MIKGVPNCSVACIWPADTGILMVRKTLDLGGMMGGYWAPPKKQLIMRISDLECFSDEYFSSFIYNSYVDIFLCDLNRRWSDKLSCLLRKGKFSVKKASQTHINSFAGGCVHKIYPTLQENVKGFSLFPSFLKFRSVAWPK